MLLVLVRNDYYELTPDLTPDSPAPSTREFTCLIPVLLSLSLTLTPRHHLRPTVSSITSCMMSSLLLNGFKYPFIACSNTIDTELTAARVSRQLYPRIVRVEPIKTTFDRISIGAAILIIGISGNTHEPRTATIHF